MKVFVATGEWGGARTQDICAVARDVVGHLSEHFGDLSYLGSGHIVVQKSPDGMPRALYREERSDPFFISLNATGNLWAKVAYQFAHELCHLLSDHDRLRKPGNGWFHESLCEMASLYVLRRMSESWKTSAPYSNWVTYAPCLASYAQEFLDQPEHRLPETPTLTEWLRENIVQLKANPCIRELNAIVAIRLLPIFEKRPSGWESVKHMPDTEAGFEEFLKEWRSCVPEHLRAVVEAIAGTLGTSL